VSLFTKPPLSIIQQVDLLRRRGLDIPNQQRAEHYLSNISYYRLSAYTLPFQIDRNTHQFATGATFDKVLDLYVFDRALRLHVFDSIERIEVAIRTQIVQQMATKHGSHWHEKQVLFKPSPYGKPSTFGILEKEVTAICNGRRNEVFIQHYMKNYKDPAFPASWMCFETLTMGMLSRIYQALADNDDRRGIASHFKLPHQVLESWLHTLSYIRNVCAHHSRLWNRELGVAPNVLHRKAKNIGPWIAYPYPANNRMYYALCCIRYLIQSINPNGSFSTRTKALITKHTPLPGIGMGIMPGWEKEPLWTA